jgi:2-polyprenyl-6-methoxyphenol hydroxylase-like FAD-dependent oxidoreductase
MQSDLCDVIVVGAGPVGLTLAMNLAHRGARVTVVESRRRGEPPEVKCNHVSARSMEVFRRLGVADALRAAGLPDDYPHDVSYRTSTVGREITRIHIPGRATRLTDHSGPDGWWPTPEPPHRINQLYLEPILFEHAAAMPGIRILNRCRLEDFEQDGQGVTARARGLDDGVLHTLNASYLVGCDGGRSGVRKAIGAQLVGDAVIQRVQSTFIRASGLIARMQAPPAWAMFSYGGLRSGNIYAIDGRETWLVHNYLRDDEPEFDSVDRDWAIRAILGVGPDFKYEVLSLEDWFGRRLVADKFRVGRVYLCGDAAHLWVPYAGYGMNAGIADANNLAWHLASVLQGWAGDASLDAYVRERQPITEQVSHFAMNHAHEMSKRRRAVPDGLDAEGSAADALRAEVGRDLYDLNVQQYCCAGLNFGYYYDRSELIAYDGEAPPAYAMGSFTPSTVPGCRLPHFWLAEGRSLYDALDPAYTLLQLDPQADTSAWVAAAQDARLPQRVLAVPAHAAPPEYRHALVLARGDGHIAWRGDRLERGAANALVARLTGRAC